MAGDAQRAIDAVWRIESARVIAGLARIVGDIGLAEDLAQDALVAALEQWPRDGVPDNPGAWLTATGKHRAIDRVRRDANLRSKQEEVARAIELEPPQPDLAEQADDQLRDDLLKLIFTACHPVLNREARVALTLKVVGAMTTADIARAFLTSEATMAQRIVRAKRTLAAARVEFELPAGAELDPRLGSVLEVIYAIFNEGHAARAGVEWIRADLAEEALRMGRILAGLMPREPEVHGLVALMELSAARFRARLGPQGEPVTLDRQDRSRWDRLLIGRGLAALERAASLGGALGPYGLQAALAACHARATSYAETDWDQIVAIYDALTEVAPGPVVALNRAVAVSHASGPEAGLELVEALVAESSLGDYHLLAAVRADLLERVGRTDEAARELARASKLAQNERERELLERRTARLAAVASN